MSDSGHCITCSDEGVPMSIVAIDRPRGMALCIDDEGAKHTVETVLVAPVAIGDEVLVHAAVALVRLTGAPEQGLACPAERAIDRPGQVTA